MPVEVRINGGRIPSTMWVGPKMELRSLGLAPGEHCYLLSFMNYTCTDASPSCDTNLTLDVVFIFKDGSTFAKVQAAVKQDANSQCPVE